MHLPVVFLGIFAFAFLIGSSTFVVAGNSSFVDEIIADLESDTMTCGGCQKLVHALKDLAHLGDSFFSKTLIKACKVSKELPEDVCEGFIAAESPVLTQVLRSLTIGSRTNIEFCASVFGFCDHPAGLPYTGTIPPPATQKKRRTKKTSNATPMQFVQVSDMHIDRSYEPNASWNCSNPICCRSYTADDAPDAPTNAWPAGPFGSFHCDTPVSLEESLYSAIKAVAPNSQFMIFTGDVVEASMLEMFEDKVNADIEDMYTRMDANGFKNVYSVVGNHDVSTLNLFQPVNDSTPVWPYNTLAFYWNKWIGTDATTTAAENSGSYSILHPGTNLRIISLSTNYWYVLNFWLYEQNGMDKEQDPGNLFAWLTNELQAAETAGESVYIIGHMPLGVIDAVRDYSHYFNLIVTRYEATIKGMFWGHTHTDEFEITYADPAKPSFDSAVITSFVAPCITPRDSNPSFRVYTVDPATFAVLDYDHYYTSLDDITSGSTKVPVWSKLYSAKEAYGSLLSPPPAADAELSAAFWHNVTTEFENNDEIFQQWYSRKTAGYETNKQCTGACKTTEICQMRASREENNCQNATVQALIKRGDAYTVPDIQDSHGRFHCGGAMADLLIAIPKHKEALTSVVESSTGNTTTLE